MKCSIPEISWHNRDPVLSVDIQPLVDEHYRLASGGTDSHVLIWYMVWNKHCSIDLELASDLSRHQRAVNAVRWSPSGEFLASGDDESVIFIWKLKEKNETINILDETNEQDKEIWVNLKILRGHLEDVYDLAWSPNSQLLLSGSVDNTAMIWDVQKGKSVTMFRDHKSFVQGVAWDPKNEYIATLSSDRYMRVFDIKTKKCLNRINKCLLPGISMGELSEKMVRMFHDDTLQTFFRRLCFSPDGNLIIAPAGITDIDGVATRFHTTYIFSRNSLKQPLITLPSPDEYTVAVKCCPVLFKLNTDGPEAVIDLPYRIVFAVATQKSVFLYDTQQTIPFAVVSNIHYTRLSDLTWSNDGRILIVSSTDGFCSIITFEPNELGFAYIEAENKNNEKDVGENSTNLAKNENKIQDEVNLNLMENDNKVFSQTPSDEVQKPALITEEPVQLALQNFIIDKEVLSVEEKFQSPSGKKTRHPTPIAIRRTPRVLNDNLNPSESNVPTQKDDVANSISSRRKLSTSINSSEEEAREPWPLPLESMETDDDNCLEKEEIRKIDIFTITETSEDIQLIVEDTQN